MRQVFINNNTGTIIIVHEKNNLDYINNNEYTLLTTNTNKQALKFIDEYWENNYIPDEQRVLINN